MAHRAVTVNLISATDLKKVKHFGTQAPAAVVGVAGTNQRKASQACSTSKTEPVWNEQFIFTVDENLLLGANPTVVIRIYSTGACRGSPVGTAQVPLSQAVNKTEELHFGAYSVYRPSGRVQGRVNVSVKIAGPKFSSEQLERARAATAPQAPHGSTYGGGMQGVGYAGGAQGYYPYPPTNGYPGAPPPQYYQPGYGQPQVVYAQRRGYGGYGGRGGFGGGGGGFGGGGMGMGTGLLLGGLGGLALGEAFDNDGGGGCGGGGCGGGGCGG